MSNGFASKLLLDLTAELLSRGTSVRFRPSGRSMYPSIREGEVITVEPVEPSDVKRGDIILYRSERGVIAHRIVQVSCSQAEADTYAEPQALVCGPVQPDPSGMPWCSGCRAMPPSAATNPLRRAIF
ncbi:hypothetical protein MYX65_01495 [Acidobacteria bacterium AH-259-L09]|nr:hypothetical protein [Acidobacteria bacterium AH-259-L09]